LKSNGNVIDNLTTSVNGGFMFSKLPTGTNYEVYATRKGYFDQKININSSGLLPGQIGKVKINLVRDPAQDDKIESDVQFTLKGKIINKAKVIQSGAVITLTNNIDKTSTEIKANQQGEYTFELRKQCHYTIKAVKGNCKSAPINKSTIGLTTSDTFIIDITLICE